MIVTGIKKNLYLDSIFLMNATQKIMKLDDVSDAVVVMGTDMNKTLLAEFGAEAAEYGQASPSDLVLSLKVTKPESMDEALALLEEMLHAKTGPAGDKAKSYPTLAAALDANCEANLVFISVPGEFAGAEAEKALNKGASVFIFSDNVPLETEVRLKNLAREKDLWVMGPGCGTTVINGISIGMMSSIGRGPIGIVGASGSGIHEIAALIDRGGSGITQAIGTGGRDLSKDVGGITMSRGIQWMLDDEATRVIVLVSKPPHPEVSEKLLKQVQAGGKPTVVFFLGGNELKVPEGIHRAYTLEEAAAKAVQLAKGETPKAQDHPAMLKAALADKAKAAKAKLKPTQKWLRGLYCGGTHNEETILMLKGLLPKIHANVGFGGATLLESAKKSVEHSLIDIGDEEFTLGKPHPVVEPSILNERLIAEALDPAVAVLVFDLLLGYGANADPVEAISPALETINKTLAKEGRTVALAATITGTDRDPQNYARQCEKLEAFGVAVFPSNAQAAIYAGLIAAN